MPRERPLPKHWKSGARMRIYNNGLSSSFERRRRKLYKLLSHQEYECYIIQDTATPNV